MDPSWLLYNDRICNFANRLNWSGIVPVREFWCRRRDRSLAKRPRDAGSVPVKELLPMCKDTRDERLPIIFGIVPLRLPQGRVNLLTLHVTVSQVQSIPMNGCCATPPPCGHGSFT